MERTVLVHTKNIATNIATPPLSYFVSSPGPDITINGNSKSLFSVHNVYMYAKPNWQLTCTRKLFKVIAKEMSLVPFNESHLGDCKWPHRNTKSLPWLRPSQKICTEELCTFIILLNCRRAALWALRVERNHVCAATITHYSLFTNQVSVFEVGQAHHMDINFWDSSEANRERQNQSCRHHAAGNINSNWSPATAPVCRKFWDPSIMLYENWKVKTLKECYPWSEVNVSLYELTVGIATTTHVN